MSNYMSRKARKAFLRERLIIQNPHLYDVTVCNIDSLTKTPRRASTFFVLYAQRGGVIGTALTMEPEYDEPNSAIIYTEDR